MSKTIQSKTLTICSQCERFNCSVTKFETTKIYSTCNSTKVEKLEASVNLSCVNSTYTIHVGIGEISINNKNFIICPNCLVGNCPESKSIYTKNRSSIPSGNFALGFGQDTINRSIICYVSNNKIHLPPEISHTVHKCKGFNCNVLTSNEYCDLCNEEVCMSRGCNEFTSNKYCNKCYNHHTKLVSELESKRQQLELDLELVKQQIKTSHQILTTRSKN